VAYKLGKKPLSTDLWAKDMWITLWKLWRVLQGVHISNSVKFDHAIEHVHLMGEIAAPGANSSKPQNA
jgi:hypothetical protein